ncbi:MAG: hypothetical protein AAF682_29470 [Planctomycetota bacterium]
MNDERNLDELLLERLSSGEISEDDPEVHARMAVSPAFRELVQGRSELLSLLNEAAREEHGTLARAAELDDAPGRGTVRDSLERARAGGAGARPLRLAPFALAAAALMALTLGAMLMFGGDDDPGPAPGPLLGAPLTLTRPSGDVERYGPFEWRYTLPRGGRFELVVHDRTGDVEGPEVFRRSLETNRCELTNDEELALPAEIEWRVRALRAGGEEMASAVTSARRSQD